MDVSIVVVAAATTTVVVVEIAMMMMMMMMMIETEIIMSNVLRFTSVHQHAFHISLTSYYYLNTSFFERARTKISAE